MTRVIVTFVIAVFLIALQAWLGYWTFNVLLLALGLWSYGHESPDMERCGRNLILVWSAVTSIHLCIWAYRAINGG